MLAFDARRFLGLSAENRRDLPEIAESVTNTGPA